AVAAAGRWTWALWLLDSMQRDGPAPDVIAYNNVLRALELRAAFDEPLDGGVGVFPELARLLLDDMRRSSLKPTLATVNHVMRICKEAGAWQQTLDVFDALRGGDFGLAANAASYQAAVAACGQARRWDWALDLLQEAWGSHSRAGLPSKVEQLEVAATTAMNVCREAQQWDWSLWLLAEARRRGIEPGPVAYNTVISACERVVQWDTALGLLGEVRRRGLRINAIGLGAAVGACENGARWASALGLLSHMDALNVEPTVITFSALVSACANADRWVNALRVFSALRGRGLEASQAATHAAAAACEASGLWQQSMALVEAQDVPDLAAQVTVVGALEQGSEERALPLLLAELQSSIPRFLVAGGQQIHQAVLAVERLEDFGVVGGFSAAAFRRSGALPILRRLTLLLGTGFLSPRAKILQGRYGRTLAAQDELRLDPLFERQPGLGRRGTEEAIAAFGFIPVSPDVRMRKWQRKKFGVDKRPGRPKLWPTVGRLGVRRAGILFSEVVKSSSDASWSSRSLVPETPVGPVSKDIAAWMSYSVQMDVREPDDKRYPQRYLGTAAGRAMGHGSGVESAMLPPVRVVHDRSAHAERGALASVLQFMERAIRGSE
ncbi:unnamed protein product, partial [Polarella glacialis]